MKSLKKVILFSLVFVGVIALSSNLAKTKVKSYYSGDAINYQGKLVVASTDSESLEIFLLEAEGLKLQMKLQPFNKRFHKNDSFYGVKLNLENGRLYAYTISGFSIFKYDISNLSDALLVKENTNTYWEWYNKIDKFGDNIATISDKGVKIFNTNLEIIDSYEISNDLTSNISSGGNGNKNLIFNLKEEENLIEIFNRGARSINNKVQINFYGGKNNRAIYFDSYDENIYFADDRSVKKVALNGALKGYFEHLGYPGYDVVSSGNEYLYFANGLGVVKLNKSDMSVVNSRRTGAITVDEGWAMGLKAVAMPGGEKIVVFNNSSIIVMDSNLEVLGYTVATQDDQVYVKENLFLDLSSAVVKSGEEFRVNGGGFLPGETLVIDFYGSKEEIRADYDGRFSRILKAPNLLNSSSRDRVFAQEEGLGGSMVKTISERSDIKVSGKDSANTYSISVEIKDSELLR